MLASSANMPYMKTTLGQELLRLRLRAGITLRGLARDLHISAAHLSDIEHDRRRPSERLLRRLATELKDVGATFETLELLVTGVDPVTRDWVASTPGVRALLRKILESGRSPQDISLALERFLEPKRPPKGGGARSVKGVARRKIDVGRGGGRGRSSTE